MAVRKIAPTNPRIASLLGDVTKGNIKIPVLQREFVWQDEQIMSLLDSIYHGYPVGSLLLWSTKERLKHERNVGGFRLPKTPEDYPVQYVLDGQQRLTTLFGVFNSDSDTEDDELAERFSVCFVPSREEFVHISAANPSESINLKNILDTTKLLPELGRFDKAAQERIANLTERFKDYEFPVVTIRDRTNQEVCRVFQRINSSGTSLSTLELLAAWTWSEQFDLRNEIQDLLERLAEKGYEDLSEVEVMRCLTAVARDSVDSDSLVDVPPDELIAAMTKLKLAMSGAIDFLEKDLLIKNVVFLPFPIMIVPLVRFFAASPKPTDAQRTSLRRWFWHCAFTQRYKAGTNRLVMEDLGKMKELAAGTDVFAKLTAKVDRSMFRKTWRINSTVAKAVVSLLAQRHPHSFINGAPVDLGNALSAYNAREFHHIYPKAYLITNGLSFHEANVIANICLLTASDNKEISDSDPHIYFQKIPIARRADTLDRALIPSEFHDGTKSFADFVTGRAEAIALAAEAAIQSG